MFRWDLPGYKYPKITRFVQFSSQSLRIKSLPQAYSYPPTTLRFNMKLVALIIGACAAALVSANPVDNLHDPGYKTACKIAESKGVCGTKNKCKGISYTSSSCTKTGEAVCILDD
jgi:hypothetical protein